MKKPMLVSKCKNCGLHQGKVEKIVRNNAIYVCPVCSYAWIIPLDNE